MNLLRCSRLLVSPETRVWYRAIQPQFWTTSLATQQTMVIPSRFNRGASARPQFQILYLAENQMVALFEVQALLGSPTPGSTIPNPQGSWTIININVQLHRVADVTQVAAQTLLDTTAQELTGDWRGYHQRTPWTSVSLSVGAAPTQELGAALFAVPGLEGFRTISAKIPYHRILVVFPQKLDPNSQIVFHHPQTGQTTTIP